MTRWTHWTGTASVSALVIAAFTAVLALLWPQLAPHHGASAPITPVQLMTFATSALMACWAITAISKFWDGSRGGLVPRLSLATAGLGVGAGIYLLEDFLRAGISDLPRVFEFHCDLARTANVWDLSPQMLATMVFCASLFGVRNWTRQTAMLRGSRLRVSSMAMTALVTAMIAAVMETNIELMMTWAAVVSATVQVSSAWKSADVEARAAA
jgi:hypothetical protein